MNLFTALDSGSAGLSAQRLRLNLIAENLANAYTTRTPEGGPYRRKEAVFEAAPTGATFKNMLDESRELALSQVRVAGILQDPAPPILKHDPSHPDADADGFVALPNINVMVEMVNMISASRSYEANVTAIKTTKNMALKALEIGK